MKKYIVRLSKTEQKVLKELTKKGKAAAYKIKHANILLAADVNGANKEDKEIARMLHCHVKTVENIRKRLVEYGLEAALERKPPSKPRRKKKLDGKQEAHLIALSCSKAPKGRDRWTLKMLSDEMVTLAIVDDISTETVRKTFKKNELKPHLRKCWIIPPEKNAEFVACMENVLDLYCLAYDSEIPLICMDEQPLQLIKEIKGQLPMQPGEVLKYDYKYERNGTANNFMFTEPLGSWRKVSIRERKTMVDWAHEIKELLDIDYPHVKKVRLVCDNLNTHKIASLYEAFEPQEARRLAQRLKIHYTPKHGSWLNVAEIELSVLTNQCLRRRIPDLQTLKDETKSWERDRNANQKSVDWQFKTDDARIKLKRLYPQIKCG
ncbi:MAG: IS630 family transposase [Candidatus Omnitrophica bacterium]|nr:IS630 family transposase [Candidatus Omnitrophota bacterium]